MPFLRSIRVRLTLWYVLIVAVTLAVFCAAVYAALRQSLYDNLDESLEARADIVSSLAVDGGELDTEGLDIPGDPLEGEEFVRVYDAAGEVVYDNSSPEFPPPDNPEAISGALAGGTDKYRLGVADIDLRARIAPLQANGEVVGALEVGLSEDDASETLSELLLIFAIVYPLALAVTAAGGVFLAGRALAPIDRVTREARQITAEDLSKRLEMDLPDDEVGRLARTFDEMIARLDESFRRQRQFTADASHELRTPLTAIKGQAEVALQRERDPAEYQAVLRAVNEEVDRMIRLVSGLLTLARADSGQIRLSREEVNLGRTVTSAVEGVRAAADERGVRLDVREGPDTMIWADEDLLLQLWLNLLDNAVKYTPAGGAVAVAWERSEDGVAVRVSDSGPGIAAEHLPRIFDRFYRADPARAAGGGGTGLGLSISRWIAEANGGSISVKSEPGRGSTFTVRLPA